MATNSMVREVLTPPEVVAVITEAPALADVILTVALPEASVVTLAVEREPRVAEKLMGSPETKELYNEVCLLIQDGVIRVVFDLTHLNWINSMGMGMIMKCLTTLNKANGHLRLVGLSEKTRSVFIMTQLINVFVFHDSVDSAVEELNKI